MGLRHSALGGGAKDNGFRWRGEAEISRIEGFSDAVFGFAVTLLVVSLEVPRSFDELLNGMRGFLAFAAGFAILFVIWLNQNKFFRRYGLQDPLTLWLNAGLLFMVLFFVYPLKFLFYHLLGGGHGAKSLALREASQLCLIYGAGYLSIFTVFLLMTWNAWSKREALALSATEQSLTRMTMREQAIQIGVAALSIGFAIWDKPSWSGLTYLLIGPALTGHGFWSGRGLRRLAEEPAVAERRDFPSGDAISRQEGRHD